MVQGRFLHIRRFENYFLHLNDSPQSIFFKYVMSIVLFFIKNMYYFFVTIYVVFKMLNIIEESIKIFGLYRIYILRKHFRGLERGSVFFFLMYCADNEFFIYGESGKPI